MKGSSLVNFVIIVIIFIIMKKKKLKKQQEQEQNQQPSSVNTTINSKPVNRTSIQKKQTIYKQTPERPLKRCPQCGGEIPIGMFKCDICGHQQFGCSTAVVAVIVIASALVIGVLIYCNLHELCPIQSKYMQDLTNFINNLK